MDIANLLTTIAAGLTVVYTLKASSDKRFEALDKRAETFENEVKTHFESLERRFDAKFDAMDRKIEALNTEFETKIEKLQKEARSHHMELSKEIKSVGERVSKVEGEMDSIRSMLHALVSSLVGHKTGTDK